LIPQLPREVAKREQSDTGGTISLSQVRGEDEAYCGTPFSDNPFLSERQE
jgi:hypothetical protein